MTKTTSIGRPRANGRTLAALLGLGALSLSTGCATMVPLTHEMRHDHDLGKEELAGLQYYTSHDITLRREITKDGRRIHGHRLVLTSGKTVEEVVIPAGTPGVAVGVEADRLAISFEPGTSLVFSIADAEPLDGPVAFAQPAPNPFPGESDDDDALPFSSSRSFGGSYFLGVSPSNGVRFNGRVYDAVEETLKAHLLIDSESLDDVVESRTVLGGRTL